MQQILCSLSLTACYMISRHEPPHALVTSQRLLRCIEKLLAAVPHTSAQPLSSPSLVVVTLHAFEHLVLTQELQLLLAQMGHIQGVHAQIRCPLKESARHCIEG